MNGLRKYLLGNLVTGLLVIAPVYLGGLLLLKGISSIAGLMQPIAVFFPDWLPATNLIALLLVLSLSVLVGMIVRTAAGQAARERMELSLSRRMPGYTLLRSLTQQLAGEGARDSLQPALATIEEALVPAFVVEELKDGRYTVFVPSAPTPLAGALYILEPERVHPVDVSFTQAIKIISRWGQGSGELVAAMGRSRRQGGVQADKSI